MRRSSTGSVRSLWATRVDLFGHVGREVEGACQRGGVGRVLLERLQREPSEVRRRVGAKQVRPSVEGVRRLAIRALARIPRREGCVGGAQRRDDSVQLGGGQRHGR